ncbi:MAG: hypothetical protein SFV21_21115 [Rhodospirillaceae bacterium]|nr:hypothetical protein [Rhodospirillaceae bacterium]
MDGHGPIAPDATTAVTAHQDQTRALVAAMMRATGLSASALARAAGLTPTTVNRFMHHPVRHTLSQRTLLALALATFDRLAQVSDAALDRAALAGLAPVVGVFERALVEHNPALRGLIAQVRHGDAPSAPLGSPAPAADVGDIPVVTGATAGIDITAGDFRGAVLKTTRPPFLAADPRAFAILMPDASMVPRYDPGDLLYVSPARGLDGPNVDAVVVEAGGAIAVRRLVGADAATVTCAKLNPPVTVTRPRGEIRSLFRVVGSHRLGG